MPKYLATYNAAYYGHDRKIIGNTNEFKFYAKDYWEAKHIAEQELKTYGKPEVVGGLALSLNYVNPRLESLVKVEETRIL